MIDVSSHQLVCYSGNEKKYVSDSPGDEIVYAGISVKFSIRRRRFHRWQWRWDYFHSGPVKKANIGSYI